ncbi:MAG: hypothetical protein HC861_01580 [Rhodospirillaceae bacterium]|nr:hypothetical protein [Rhodospirillaceae bacterium]
MAMQHESLLARRHAQHIDMRALQPGGTAEAEELRLRIRLSGWRNGKPSSGFSARVRTIGLGSSVIMASPWFGRTKRLDRL